MPDVELLTPRLVLRRVRMADARAFHGMFSDPEAMRYWSRLPHETLAETEAWLASTIAAVEAGTGDDFAVTLNGAVIGKAGLWMGAEVGMIFDRAHWGLGYAREAVTAVITRGFAAGIEAITADVDPRNAASLRVLEGLGFQRTGTAERTFQIGGIWVGSVYLALAPAQFGGMRCAFPPCEASNGS